MKKRGPDILKACMYKSNLKSLELIFRCLFNLGVGGDFSGSS